MHPEPQMRLAIEQARLAMGSTHPNPAVGAAILHAGECVAQGYTQPAGGDHAEVMALKEFAKTGISPDETTRLVVTLEPCSTTGRTPPCTDAIIQSGIRDVVVGAVDPNPDHAGKGMEILREAGVNVTSGILEDECEDLNLIFNWQMSHGGPFFAGKIATTIDGRIGTRGGSSKWITGNQAREDVHRWRRYFPAIAVGAGTILADNPSLTIRVPQQPEACSRRMVFDRNLITFKGEPVTVYTDEWKDQTLVISSVSRKEQVEKLKQQTGIEFWLVDDTTPDGGLGEFSRKCEETGIGGLMIEGGTRLLTSFLSSRLLSYLFAYRAPLALADARGLPPFVGFEPAQMSDSLQLSRVRHAIFGDDQLMRGFVCYPGK